MEEGEGGPTAFDTPSPGLPPPASWGGSCPPWFQGLRLGTAVFLALRSLLDPVSRAALPGTACPP